MSPKQPRPYAAPRWTPYKVFREKAAPYPKGHPGAGPPISEEQKRAVETTEGPCLIIAGAGSGKTLTLSAKAELIKRQQPGARVLCVTHTRKAAEHMRARISRGDIHVWTFHSLAYRLVKSLNRGGPAHNPLRAGHRRAQGQRTDRP